ncbi:TATA-binding protein-associated factor mot1 [Rhizopus stolonifer]|uniref:TATA-binding protein-associated factor mot1 n=1 Tax=Rhizopus stolonifer TaxID=4846 RepID=A0A367KQ63_RHIST|nr:TATA-binding protein-associated factor mot1 [Rhizopus stolonifer]
MATRLDRLVLLLDTGSTTAVRRTAAQQLGEIQKQHPGELYNLLSRIVVHLRSKAWDTRWAAGQALEAIAANVPAWDPEDQDAMNEDQPEDLHKLQFSQFDLASVLQHGKLLLGSAGKEYDIDFSDMTPQERLELQRRNLKERLGLASQFMDVDLVDDADLDTKQNKMKTETKSPSPSPSTSTTAPTPAVAEINMAGLSARERNMLKRKMKLESKMKGKKEKVRVMDLKGKSEPKPVKIESKEEFEFTAQPQSDKFVVEVKKPVQENDQVDEVQRDWPFKMVCEHLCLDLFDPAWEIRHGAGIGLRSILKAHGEGAGKRLGRKEKNQEMHNAWLEDVAIRLLCVFALDRFADFVSDQVVCPVRETCSQTLGVVLQYMTASSVEKVHQNLLQLINQNDASFQGKSIWEVRHAGLLGLKYTVAVRKDLVDMLVDGTTGAVILGLRDHDDDVRAVSASTLLPITAEFVRMSSKERIRDVITTLWDCLIDLKDDLTASTGAVMDLISKMFEQPGVMDIVRQGCSLSELVPRLHPFFRHTITSVRIAVLNTLLTFIECGTAAEWIDDRVYRLVFQNLIVEEKVEIIEKTLTVWKGMTIGGKVDNPLILQGTQNWLGSWFEITMTPIGQPLDIATYFYKPPGAFGNGGTFATTTSAPTVGTNKKGKKAANNNIGNIRTETVREGADRDGHNLDAGMIAQDFSLITTEQVMRCRIACTTALGMAMSTWPDDSMEMSYQEVLLTLLSSQWALKRQLGAMAVEEWAKAVLKTRYNADCISHAPPEAILANSHNFPRNLSEAMIANLETAQTNNTEFYFELVHVLKRIRGECQNMVNAFHTEAKVPLELIPTLPSLVPGEALPDQGPLFTIETATGVVGETFEQLLAKVPRSKGRAALITALEDRQKRVVASIGYFEELKQKIEINVYASTAGAVVELGVLPTKLNPVIRSVMNSIKYEENLELQKRSAATLTDLIALCELNKSRSNPNDKVVKNLCTFLCSDTTITPVLQDNQVKSAILSIAKEETGKANANKEVLTQEQKDAQLMKRGAEITLRALCDTFGDRVFDIVPKLKECISQKVIEAFPLVSTSSEQSDNLITTDFQLGQDVIDSLAILNMIIPYLSKGLWDHIIHIVPHICKALQSCYAVIRHVSARCLAAIANVITTETMQIIVDKILPQLGNTLNAYHRQGASELVYHLVQLLDTKILPYTTFLIVPILGRMSDVDEAVRLTCTNCFALLIKLVPLEAGIPDPPGMSAEMLAQRDEERRFLSQLLDSSKVENFTIPVKINAELRKYQQEGVNWLAFLNKFHLHGILCDDMGLGKTLQSICILASDHFHRAQKFDQSKSQEWAPIPSVVICPPTLTGHWYHEILNYCGNLKPLLYTGGPAERKRLRSSISRNDVIIMSYDIIRNDIEELSAITWNYCILDEGHIIKNGKTKITKAIKSLRSDHRLILSGTPIQNNVLELWSLFDFLMPGFLGSEKIFNERFGKPILASRDSKSSSKEQEAGALALEALHKQVLPFLLRRLKEDVLHDLPPKIIQDYYCELSDLQKSLYDEFAKSQAKSSVEQDLVLDKKSTDKPKGATHIFQALQYLRRLCNHPLLVVSDKYPNYKKVESFLQKTNANIHSISNAPKLQALKQLLGECGIAMAVGAVSQHRALIFCQLKPMLDIIENDLFKTLMPTVSYLRLDGSVDSNKRHEMFKLNIANSIVNQQNSGLQSMDTDQILDLFNVGEGEDTKKKKAKNQDASAEGLGVAKAVLDNLETLWDEKDYEEEYNIDSFISSLT